MKRAVPLSLMWVCVLTIVSGTTTGVASRESPAEELHGVWVNMQYADVRRLPAIILFEPDGYCAEYLDFPQDDPDRFGSYEITGKRRNQRGNIIYRVERNYEGSDVQYLTIILDRGGKRMRGVWSSGEYPEVDVLYRRDTRYTYTGVHFWVSPEKMTDTSLKEHV
jgi:hypothetical protein